MSCRLVPKSVTLKDLERRNGLYFTKLVVYGAHCVKVVDKAITINKNSSGDEIADVNFLTTISHTRRPTSKYRKRDKPTSFNKLDDT